MRVGLYPGSFNPWHEGHEDILKKALQVFDHVIIGVGVNPGKSAPENRPLGLPEWYKDLRNKYGDKVGPLCHYGTLLVDFIKNHDEIEEENYKKYISSGTPRAFTGREKKTISAVIRGLRNGDDLQYEMNQQYWNEDLGLTVPVVYFVTDRKLAHISSSAIREIEKFKKIESPVPFDQSTPHNPIALIRELRVQRPFCSLVYAKALLEENGWDLHKAIGKFNEDDNRKHISHLRGMDGAYE